ncbi:MULTISPECIES: MobF family relaxase [Promicromonospora]|uniref:AAA+ ATPase domain-containing protein n=2 Tax=Promicromonospora TaxID=43676 RepID=A0ABP8YD27_9MICO|nr:MobF family relaxase [Promicromonospora umidemergens]
MSIRKVSAGDGYAYLLRSVVRGDGDRSAPDRVTRYYLEAGTPPGFWLGSGLEALDPALAVAAPEEVPGGRAADIAGIADGDMVTEDQLKLLIGAGRHPITGARLGRDYRTYKPAAQRIDERVAKLDRWLTDDERSIETAAIESEEHRAGDRHSVAGFDLTFSVPKSVSVLWALADANTQARIVEAHHAAVRETLGLLERHVAATRVGKDGIAQADVAGIIAAAFDHWDSRTNDPQLHTHVVLSNKVMTLADGQWRTLDGQLLFAAAVALSAHYDAVLRDRLTGTFGLAWERRRRGADRNPQWEIDGVSEELIAEFSTRSTQINAATDVLIAQYIARHGRRPSKTTVGQLRAQATLATRPEKTLHSLHDLTTTWRRRAARLLPALDDGDPVAFARRLTTSGTARTHGADQVPDDALAKAAASTLATVSDSRATWTHWNLWAEASRQTAGWRLTSAADREQVTARIVALAEAGSVPLTPSELAPTPTALRRPDGTTMLRPKHHTVFSSTAVWDAEQHLLDLAGETTAPTLRPGDPAFAAQRPGRGRNLSREQASAVGQVAASGRTVDVLVGPAGAGKTTTMRALVRAWTSQHGRGSVVALAPSAAAAKVLGQDVGLHAETTAKWLHDHTSTKPWYQVELRRGQLVIVDEATLAGTHTLNALATAVERAGAKLLLVGDPAQLQAVDAGGAFAMLVNARTDPPRLLELHRFTHAWEKTASLALRDGRPEAVPAYDDQGRLHDGTTQEMADAAYTAWHHDHTAGLTTVLVADTNAMVAELNRRARADRILAGEVDTGRALALADGTEASEGDLVITRRNRRRLVTARGGFVRNGDRWQITHVRRDGSIDARRVLPSRRATSTSSRLGSSVILPAQYVAEHLNLGYAVTAHRAQGITVDTAHVLVTTRTVRENLYVALTRGRHANHAYVATDLPDDDHTPPAENPTARAILYRILARPGAELSAHETHRAEHEKWTGRDRLIAEYEHIADVAQRPRWIRLVTSALSTAGKLTPGEADTAVMTDAFGPMCRALRRAEALGHDVETLLPRVAAQPGLLIADDVCAMLGARLNRAARKPGTRDTHFVADGVPEALGAMTQDERAALEERARVIAALAERDAATVRPPPDSRGQVPSRALPLRSGRRDRAPLDL